MYTRRMTKHTVITFLGILVVVVALGGFPMWARTTILVASGICISVLAYLSSVVFCSNCEKLIDDAEKALPASTSDREINTPSSQ